MNKVDAVTDVEVVSLYSTTAALPFKPERIVASRSKNRQEIFSYKSCLCCSKVVGISSGAFTRQSQQRLSSARPAICARAA